MRTSRRILAVLALSGLALVALAAPATAVTAATAATAATASPARTADTSDFTFDSFDAQYQLSRDADNRSLLTTTETLVAVFPPDQNRGIVRDIPTTYRGHTTQVHIVSVTDENGDDRDYESSFISDSRGSFLELRIGVEEGDFAPAGANTYVITYTQKDVTLDPDDSSADEFYWDVNGVGWDQPFAEVSASLTVSDDLVDSLNGDAACYYGPGDASTRCDIADDGTGVLTATTSDLPPRNNMTIAVGFAPGTFAPAKFELFAFVSPVSLAGIGAVLLAAVAAVIARLTALRGARGTGIVVAQYEAPTDVGIFLAANLEGVTKRGMGAAIVDLAVRGKTRMIEKPAEGFFANGTTFGVQYISDTGLSAADDAVMSALFSSGTGADNIRWMTKSDTALGKKVVTMTKAAADEAVNRGLRRKPSFLPVGIVGALLAIGILMLFLSGGLADSESATFIGIFGGILALVLSFVILAFIAGRRPLTTEGALLKERLDGLREYIRLAEADRLQMLQSVTGAERIGSTTRTDGATIVKIYERLLPYAILFGLEKEWATELAKYYDETPPDWYSGGNAGAFQVAAFAASVSSFSSTTSTSYSGSASSSSSGGSSGGGSSGGGGGGGGGGGF